MSTNLFLSKGSERLNAFLGVTVQDLEYTVNRMQEAQTGNFYHKKGSEFLFTLCSLTFYLAERRLIGKIRLSLLFYLFHFQ